MFCWCTQTLQSWILDFLAETMFLKLATIWLIIYLKFINYLAPVVAKADEGLLRRLPLAPRERNAAKNCRQIQCLPDMQL
jgi:hypothetical protein